MSSLAACPPAGDPIEVLGVPSDEHPFLRGGELEHLLVRQTGIGGNLRDREDVVPRRRQPATDAPRREVLVEEEPHPLLPEYRGIPNERCQLESLLGRPIVVSDLLCDLVGVRTLVCAREVAVARLDQREIGDERLRVRVAID